MTEPLFLFSICCSTATLLRAEKEGKTREERRREEKRREKKKSRGRVAQETPHEGAWAPELAPHRAEGGWIEFFLRIVPRDYVW
jgi:hypothetical protein